MLFQTTGVRRITKKNIHFVLVDSLAMHGDNCDFCAAAQKTVKSLAEELSCMKKSQNTCELTYPEDAYSRPILLQHFPLFRENDRECHDEPDVLQWAASKPKIRIS